MSWKGKHVGPVVNDESNDNGSCTRDELSWQTDLRAMIWHSPLAMSRSEKHAVKIELPQLSEQYEWSLSLVVDPDLFNVGLCVSHDSIVLAKGPCFM